MNSLRRAFVALSFSVAVASSFGSEGARIEMISEGDCSFETGVDLSLSFPIYDSRDGPVKGWSHIVTDPSAFPLTALENSKYAVDGRSMETDEDCPEQPIFRTVLVRKMSDWGQQHANGIEPVFFDRPVRVDELESVTLLIKFHSADSRVPSPEQLREHYGAYFTEDQIAGLDTGLACIGLTFMGDGYQDPGEESLTLQYFLSLDPDTDFDRWLSVMVPMDAFSYGFEKNYSTRSVPRTKVRDRELVGFRVNPETTGGIVSRHYVGDAWDDTIPELYKEMSISLARIEGQLAN